MIRTVVAVLAFLRGRPVLARLAGAGAFLLAGLTGAGGAQEVPRSRVGSALSFASVVREAAPAVVNIYARKGRAAEPFLSDPFFRSFFKGFHPLPSAPGAGSRW